MGDSHWSEKVSEYTVSAILPDRCLHLTVYGCSDTGQFCLVSPRINHSRISYRDGINKLNPHDVILEVHGYKVSGYTQSDLDDLIQSMSVNSEPILIKTVPRSLLPSSLKEYLGLSFRPDSLDQDLQRVIRDNVYLRVVPCTTRQPRSGEVNGVDYQFLSIEEFLELEKSDGLLESGMFEGNYYGTPKPSSLPLQQCLPLAGQMSSEAEQDEELDDEQQLGSLPVNWEVAYTDEGYRYFIDHNQGSTQWHDPRLPPPPASPSYDDYHMEDQGYPNFDDLNLDEPLPPGWEKVFDPKYGVFYIDHNNKKTQYEPPEMLAKHQQHFTGDPSKLAGPIHRTHLIKSPHGFGFTIIGGSERSQPPEFLQVKHVMPGGPADLDGVLKPGDVLVYVDTQLVLGLLHADIVRLFQAIQIGQQVCLTVAKGYRLPCDLGDPRSRVVTTLAVNGSSAAVAAASGTGPGTPPITGSDHNSDGAASLSSSLSNHNDQQQQTTSNTSAAVSANVKFFAKNTQPEFIKVNIPKSSTGFGFTVSDSTRGQRVKQVLDPSRCSRLREGDVLVEINTVRVKEMRHHDVVQLLKDLPEGAEVCLLLQRGCISAQSSSSSGYSSASKAVLNSSSSNNNSPLPPNAPVLPPKMSLACSLSSSTLSQSALQSRDTVDRQGLSDMAVAKYLSQQPRPGSTSSSQDNGSAPEAMTTGNRSRTPGPEGGFHHRSSRQRGLTGSDDPCDAVDTNDGLHDLVTGGHYGSGIGGDYSSVPRRPKTPTAAEMRAGSSSGMWALQASMGPPRAATTTVLGDPTGSGHTPDYIPASAFLVSRHSNISSHNSDPVSGTSTGQTNNIPQYGSLSRPLQRSIQPVPSSSNHSDSSYSSTNQNQDGAVPQVFFTTLHKQANGFGFRIIGGAEDHTKISIGPLVPDGAAARSQGQVREGDELVSVNGAGVVGATHRRVVQLVEAAARLGSVTLGLRRFAGGSGQVRSYISSSRLISRPNSTFDVTLTRTDQDEGFGFVIVTSMTRSGGHMGEFIGKLIEKSPAERCGLLRVGDRILAVNCISVSKLRHEKIVANIKQCGRSVTLRISPVPETSSDTEFEVSLSRTNRGYGFSIRGDLSPHSAGSSSVLFVLRIADDGPAARDGRLRIGDRILRINGRSTSGMSHADAISAIQASSGNQLRLLVKRGTPSGLHSLSSVSSLSSSSRRPVMPPHYVGSPAASSGNRSSQSRSRNKR